MRSFKKKKVQPHFAVVRPFWMKELRQMVTWLKENSTSRVSPCGVNGLPVDLVLYYAGYPGDPVVDFGGVKISKVLERTTIASSLKLCFQSVRMKYANIGNDVKYPFSACHQFTRMYSYFPNVLFGYKSIYYMEMDMYPVREGWLDKLIPYLKQARNGSSGWVIGGTTDERCMVRMNVRTNHEWKGNAHINGNAIYTSAIGWKTKVVEHEALCNRPYSAGASYDFKLWYDHRRHPVLNSKWVAIDLIKNCKPSTSHKKAGWTVTVPRDKIVFKYPDVMLVHSSYDLNKEEK